jgi:hypothetical protein
VLIHKRRAKKNFCSRRSRIGEGLSTRDQRKSELKREQGQPQEDPTDQSHNNEDELYVLHRSLKVSIYAGYSVGKRAKSQATVR